MKRRMKPILVAAILVTSIFVAVLIILKRVFPGSAREPDARQVFEPTRKIMEAAGRGMGIFLATTAPNAKPLILRLDPKASTLKTQADEILISGLSSAFTNLAEVATFEYVTMTEQGFRQRAVTGELINREEFDRAIKRHGDRDLIITLVGLPSNYRETEPWLQSSPAKPTIVVPFSWTLGRELKKDDFRTIMAIVVVKPDGVMFKLDDSPQELFDKYLFLVRSENFEDLCEKYRKMGVNAACSSREEPGP